MAGRMSDCIARSGKSLNKWPPAPAWSFLQTHARKTQASALGRLWCRDAGTQFMQESRGGVNAFQNEHSSYTSTRIVCVCAIVCMYVCVSHTLGYLYMFAVTCVVVCCCIVVPIFLCFSMCMIMCWPFVPSSFEIPMS